MWKNIKNLFAKQAIQSEPDNVMQVPPTQENYEPVIKQLKSNLVVKNNQNNTNFCIKDNK